MPLTFSRESLQATSKTQGDFNLQNRFSIEIDGVSVTGGPHTIDGIEDGPDEVGSSSGQTRRRPGVRHPVVLRMALTREQSDVVFYYTGKWAQEFAFTQHALKVLAARARRVFRSA